MSVISRRSFLTTVASATCLSSASLRPIVAGPSEMAPEFSGLENWINSSPLTMAELKDNIVLVDFWTFGCSNCVSTLPHLTNWHDEMASKGLVIVGIHTPEFPFERDFGALEKAVKRHGIKYPVVQDNRYATWLAYEVRYWPTSVIVDRDGRVIKYHEGDRGMEELGEELRVIVDV